jgi:hypothetical protein
MMSGNSYRKRAFLLARASFEESTGIPVHRFVLERRVERPRHLPQGAQGAVTEVAFDTGVAHHAIWLGLCDPIAVQTSELSVGRGGAWQNLMHAG